MFTFYFVEDSGDDVKMTRDDSMLITHPASHEYQRRRRNARLPTGTPELDELLGGGVLPDRFYLLWGQRKTLACILHQLVIRAFLPPESGGIVPSPKIVFVDGDFSFDPYFITRQAILHRLNPSLILDRIQVARAFDWQNMVELVSERLKKLDARLYIITGLTVHFNPAVQNSYRELLKIVGAFKSVLLARNAIGVVTTRQDPHSFFKPMGGKILSHFATVMVQVIVRSKFTEYRLLKGGKPHKTYQWHVQDLPLQTSLDHFWRKG